MRDDGRRRHYYPEDEAEPVGRHAAPSRRREPAWEEEPPRRQEPAWEQDAYDEPLYDGDAYDQSVYEDDEDVWYEEPRYEEPQARTFRMDENGRAYRADARQPQPRRRAPAADSEPWRDRAARERTVRRVEVQPPAYRSRGGGRKGQNALLIVLIVVLAGGMLFAGGKLLSIFLNYRRDRSAYDDLAHRVITGLKDDEEEDDAPEVTPPPEEETAPAAAPYAVDWNSLKSSNSDVVAWLICPDTPINYPIVQTYDNDFYLHRGFDKQTNTSGTLFADKDSSLGITQSNFIVYGHNMKDGSMFAAVEDYLDPNFYERHPIMYLLTPNGDYTVELIAGHIVESTVDNYPGYFSSAGDYSTYLSLITSQSSFYSHFSLSTDYQLITLSTCDYSNNYVDPRYLLHGLLVPIR